jgi:hypothetical protein
VLVSDPRFETYLSRLRQEFPRYVLVVEPFRNPDEEPIEHFLHLLEVPEDDLLSSSGRALEIAFDMYGDDPLPFHLTSLDPEISRQYYATALEEARRKTG